MVWLTCKKQWNVGREKVVKLPEDRPESFELYLRWLYGRKIYVQELAKSAQSARDCNELDKLITDFVFGEKVQDDDYKDAILDTMIAHTINLDKHGQRWFPGIKGAARIYNGTPSGSPARLHRYCHCCVLHTLTTSSRAQCMDTKLKARPLPQSVFRLW